MNLKSRCPSGFELRLQFNNTLFGQLYALINNLNKRWTLLNEAIKNRTKLISYKNSIDLFHISIQSTLLRSQRQQIQFIGETLCDLLVASSTYNSVPAYFVDSVLNGLFSYWPFFPLETSTNHRSSMPEPKSSSPNPSPRLSWHERIAKVFTHFMRKPIYADYDGKPNPETGAQLTITYEHAILL